WATPEPLPRSWVALGPRLLKVEGKLGMSFVVALALFAQTLALPQAYTLTDPTTLTIASELAVDLATPSGIFLIGLGPGCGGIGAGQNVLVLYGSGDVGTINPIGSPQLCQIVFAAQLSDKPCATNADGLCDYSVHMED